MYVSVVICTWNRARLLERVLRAFHCLEIPAGVTWELLVVNNGCTDDTDAVIDRHRGVLPIHRLYEPRLGLSIARNSAMRIARGELILWTDDDAFADPNWLSSYVAAAQKWPGASFFGGTVRPHFEQTPSPWILNNLALLEGPLALRDLGPVERPLGECESVYGVNFAVRLKDCSGQQFDPSLGRRGHEALLGEETHFLAELRSRGRWGVWVPTAGVAHWAPPERFTWRYLWRYFEGVGRTEWKLGINRPTVSDRKRLTLYRKFSFLLLKALWKNLLRQTDRMAALSEAAQMRGLLTELFSRAGSKGHLIE